jgi:hypothetical protein
MDQSFLESIKDQLAAYLNVSGKTIVPLGIILQLVGVAAAIRLFLRDDNIRIISWVKALALSVMFIVGAPVIAQSVSALVLWLVPLILGNIDVLGVLSRFSSVDVSVAGASRPWAYLLTILGTTILVYRQAEKRISNRRPSSRIYAFTFGTLLVLHVFFQLLCYVVFLMRRSA